MGKSERDSLRLSLEKVKELLKSPTIFDGRNIYDPKAMKERGFNYRGMGRGIEDDGK